jgi:hypothetical protein
MSFFEQNRDFVLARSLLLANPWGGRIASQLVAEGKLPKSYGTSEQEVYSLILDKTVSWLKR